MHQITEINLVNLTIGGFTRFLALNIVDVNGNKVDRIEWVKPYVFR